LTKSTRAVVRPRQRVMIRDSSPTLAREHGQWGWTTMTRVGRPDWRGTPSGHRAGAAPFLPGVAEWISRACIPVATARIQTTTRSEEPERDFNKASTPHFASMIPMSSCSHRLENGDARIADPHATAATNSFTRFMGAKSGRCDFTAYAERVWNSTLN
jgi:hypothetical protein